MAGLRHHLGHGLRLHHLGLQRKAEMDLGIEMKEEMEEERRHGQELQLLQIRMQEAERRLQELLRPTSYQPTQWKS